MLRSFAVLLSALLLPAVAPPKAVAPAPAEFSYTADGEMIFPANYREWIYLSSGLDMSYAPSVKASDHPVFDNVFVNPSAYKAFLTTGTWPDKTALVLEIRGSDTKASIDQRGHSQAKAIAYEVHVKDGKLPGGWGFFQFGKGLPSVKVTPQTADCYQCHAAHAAVDTTFVQFYPTLIDLAKEKNTLSAAYLKEMPAPAAAQVETTPAKP